jgi:hypothetical protein
MSLKIGVIRYASVAESIARALGVEPAADIVVVYQDASVVRGCAVVGRWEFVVSA